MKQGEGGFEGRRGLRLYPRWWLPDETLRRCLGAWESMALTCAVPGALPASAVI